MGWVGLGGFVIVMTRTHPDPLLKKNHNPTQPNPTRQPLKTDPTRRVGLGRVGFGGLAAHLLIPLLRRKCLARAHW